MRTPSTKKGPAFLAEPLFLLLNPYLLCGGGVGCCAGGVVGCELGGGSVLDGGAVGCPGIGEVVG